MHIGAPARDPADDQVRPDKTDPHEQPLGLHGPAADARAHRDVSIFLGPSARQTGSVPEFRQDETSDSQLIARWRSRARSPMSMPVAVAT